MLTNLTNRDGDRFITNREKLKMQYQASPSGKFAGQESAYSNLIKKELLSQDLCSSFSTQDSLAAASEKLSRKESGCTLQSNVGSPVKILDVPRFRDDFYLSNVDWSRLGPLGIALDNEVFLYTPDNLQEVRIDCFNNHVTGLKMEDQLMALGLSNGLIDLYDI
jgi:hypothetical protein